MTSNNAHKSLEMIYEGSVPLIDAEAEVSTLSDDALLEYIEAVMTQTELLEGRRDLLALLEDDDSLDSDGRELLEETACLLQAKDRLWLARTN